MLRENVAVTDAEAAHAETVDKALDALILGRSKQNERQRPEEVSYAASVGRYHATQDAARREAWREYHEAQAARHRRSLQALVAFHETRAQALLPEQSEPTKGRTP